MAVAVVQSQAGTFSDGNTGHAVTFGSTATSGNLLVLAISSDTIVSTPSGWTLPTNGSRVGGQGAYLFWKKSAGTETGVTVTTSGNNATAFSFVEYSGTASSPFDVATNVGVDGTGATATPSVTLTAAAAGELHVFAACLHVLGGAGTSPSWSNGVTQLLNSGFNASSPGEQQFYGHVLAAAGTATTTVASWSAQAASDRYTIAAAFKPAAGGSSVTGTAAGSLVVAGTATGVPNVQGTAAGSLTIAGTAQGVPTAVGTAAGSLAVAGTATGVPTVVGAAAGSVVVAGTAAGVPTALGTAAGTLAVAGTASGLPTVVGQAAGSLVVTGTASGATEGSASGTAAGSLVVAGTASGLPTVFGVPAGPVQVAGTAAGVRTTFGTAAAALTLTPAVIGARVAAGVAAGSLVVAGTAAGSVPLPFTVGALRASTKPVAGLAASSARAGPR